ncbi:MAG: LysR family transcriptional regulator [Pseudomonadota bacterium]
MDWRSVNFDWNRARAFLVTAEEGSLSAAARALHMTQPTLGRQVSALEQELGVVLFERAGRGLTLTPSGLELLEHVRTMGDAANHLTRVASGQAQAVEGSVRVTASETFSVFLLPKIVEKLRRLHPGITVEVVASNNVSDLRRREADIAIRNGQPTDPDLIARKIKDETAHLYAARSYLKKLGDPQKPEEFAGADFLGFDNNDDFLEGLNWAGLSLGNLNFPIVCNNHLVHWEMTKQGLGIGVMASIVGDAEPKVRRALPWLEPFKFPVWLVAHREVNTSRRVRLVFDLLAEELSALPSTS